jgi:hypothetical protein
MTFVDAAGKAPLTLMAEHEVELIAVGGLAKPLWRTLHEGGYSLLTPA